MANEPRGAGGSGEARGAGEAIRTPPQGKAVPATGEQSHDKSEQALPKGMGLPPVGPAILTFIGGAEAGNVGSNIWGTEATGMIEFPLRQPVLVDPDAAATESERKFFTHIIDKARGNPFFTVAEAKEGHDARPAEVKRAEPQPRTQPNPQRGRSSSA